MSAAIKSAAVGRAAAIEPAGMTAVTRAAVETVTSMMRGIVVRLRRVMVMMVRVKSATVETGMAVMRMISVLMLVMRRRVRWRTVFLI